MRLSLIVSFALSMCVTALHIFALVLIFKVKKNNLMGNQKYLIAGLSIAEMLYGVIKCTKDALLFYNIGGEDTDTILQHLTITATFTNYILLMTFITLDRMFVIRLNIKYSLYWSPKKTFILIAVTLLFSAFTFICFLVVFLTKRVIFEKYIFLYIGTTLQLLYLIIVAITYYYIIKLLRNNRKERTKTKVQLKCTCISANNNLLKNRFYIIYPSMIIASFILFMVLPTFIIGLVNEYIYSLTNEASQTVRVLYPIGFIIDPLLYIFNLDVIRKRARRIFTCWRKK